MSKKVKYRDTFKEGWPWLTREENDREAEEAGCRAFEKDVRLYRRKERTGLKEGSLPRNRPRVRSKSTESVPMGKKAKDKFKLSPKELMTVQLQWCERCRDATEHRQILPEQVIRKGRYAAYYHNGGQARCKVCRKTRKINMTLDSMLVGGVRGGS